MSLSDNTKTGLIALTGSVLVASIAGLVAYIAATIQSGAALQAAIETASASNLTGYVVEKGIWIVGKGDKAIVYCEIPPAETDKDVASRRIYCTKTTHVLTY